MAIGRDEKIAMVVLAGFVGYVLLSGKSEKQRLETAVMENTKLNNEIAELVRLLVSYQKIFNRFEQRVTTSPGDVSGKDFRDLMVDINTIRTKRIQLGGVFGRFVSDCDELSQKCQTVLDHHIDKRLVVVEEQPETAKAIAEQMARDKASQLEVLNMFRTDKSNVYDRDHSAPPDELSRTLSLYGPQRSVFKKPRPDKRNRWNKEVKAIKMITQPNQLRDRNIEARGFNPVDNFMQSLRNFNEPRGTFQTTIPINVGLGDGPSAFETTDPNRRDQIGAGAIRTTPHLVIMCYLPETGSPPQLDG